MKTLSYLVLISICVLSTMSFAKDIDKHLQAMEDCDELSEEAKDYASENRDERISQCQQKHPIRDTSTPHSVHVAQKKCIGKARKNYSEDISKINRKWSKCHKAAKRAYGQ